MMVVITGAADRDPDAATVMMEQGRASWVRVHTEIRH
ncbi:hypothetical protein NRB56_28820 [Nocardia sp. RB56]|uniref:Uncharacterized protein n=1 Tax=Nocardia aurantia TaxID=2585199 RepID=A0A7K0DNK1_9NOCA|nr:hypothetical protein [Nocardia aurantia]